MKDDKKLSEITQLNEKYLRALADYQNLQKQTDTWKMEFLQYANINLIGKLLEVLDDLEKAQEHLKDEGLGLVVSKLTSILKDEGIEELDILGQEYNPETAEVVGTETGEENHKIAKILQKGYKIKDKIIRVAKVIVWEK